jgi:prepilin-type N-terminal cleavage/methylation domain-containing protein
VKRHGYTLFEMVIVVAMILLMAGLAIPSIEGMYADNHLQSAVDQVSGKWAEIRTRAILEGRPYRFCFAPNGMDFRVGPDSPAFWSGGDPPTSSDSGPQPLVAQDSLPPGIQFDLNDQSDPNSAGASSSMNSSGGSWITYAVFLPDGTAQHDVALTFRYKDCTPVALRLRALTGGVSTRLVRADGSVQ